MKFPPFPFVVLDTETTGFVPRVHRIIEFASVRVEGGTVVEEYEELFHAEEIPPHVEVLTRIRTEDVKDKVSCKEKAADVLKKMPLGTLLVGQNLGFDIGMLKGEGIDVSDYAWVDTSMLASLVFPELESFSLGYLSDVLKLNHAPKHRAMGDVHATLELLSKVWERLMELPEDLLETAREIGMKSTPGYKILFEALPKATATTRPTWLEAAAPKNQKLKTKNPSVVLSLPLPKKGEVSLLEEPLEPSHFHDLIRTAVADTGTVHWIAVKNLDATVRRLPDDLKNPAVRILYPPQLLLDAKAAETLLLQETFTADEATLAIKLAWYRPRIREDFPLHGGEEAVWNGRIACTDQSKSYIDQFHDLPSVLLLDHRQLLGFVANPDHVAYELPGMNAHVIIDDASMLEDTATKAYGWFCMIDDLRAASEGNALLTKVTDIVSLWVERVRHEQDIHYISPSDLETPETKGLHGYIEDLLKMPLPAQTLRHLQNLDHLLEPENLTDRFAWVEIRQNGSQTLQSVPERVGKFLGEHLYKRFPTSLLIPAFTADILPEILPSDANVRIPSPMKDLERMPMSLKNGLTNDQLVSDPPAGKSIILLSSKSQIEDMYVKHMENLEAKGITLICQGLSGGQGRMQAEFTAATAPAVWLITPWTFEGIDLPPGTVDHLYIRALPFDFPSHPIFSRRSQRYKDGFKEYCVPRLLHRLFRLLRTYSRFRTENGDVFIQDDRVHTKAYGKTIKEYLEHFAADPAAEPKKKSAGGPQLAMF